MKGRKRQLKDMCHKTPSIHPYTDLIPVESLAISLSLYLSLCLSTDIYLPQKSPSEICVSC